MGVPPQMLEVKGSHKKLQIARSPSSSHPPPPKKHQQDFNSVLKLIAFSATLHCRPGESSRIVSLIIILVFVCHKPLL